jgi:hypothetical protein
LAKRQPAWQNRVIKAVKAVDCWWTTSEWGVDRRTGAIAVLVERDRCHDDRVASTVTKVWWWRVVAPSRMFLVDPRKGNDENDGTTMATALRTFAEQKRRSGTLAEGVSVNQRGARSAARRFVRTLPTVAEKIRNKTG